MRSELLHSSSCGSKRPVSSDVDMEILGGPPSKTVMSDMESVSKTSESSSRNLLRMSIVGQSVPSTSHYDGTDYGTSELESSARKKAHEPVRTNVSVGSSEGFSLYSISETCPGLGTGRTKF